ncbi:MAG: hypothetical protein MR011_04975 [Lachnospiraceae bacterium]|nr:hypothetical protein [Lachnospiraceae bacterium]
MKAKKITAAVENKEQFEAVLKSGKVNTCYIDSCYFDAFDYAGYVRAAHEKGVACGLRMPQLWRDKADKYFTDNAELIKSAGFDYYLFRNLEGLLFFKENGLLCNDSATIGDDVSINYDGSDAISKEASKEASSVSYMLDYSIYMFNKEAFSEIMTMLEASDCAAEFSGITLPLELNLRELKRLNADIKNQIAKNAVFEDNAAAEEAASAECRISTELTIYGRVPMMVSSQCVKKTAAGCDKKPATLTLKDRTGALMPVKNCCRFCFGTVYNSVPSVLYDMTKEVEEINADSLRYEFTTETGREVVAVLNGEKPENGAFTRGHFKKSVE